MDQIANQRIEVAKQQSTQSKKVRCEDKKLKDFFEVLSCFDTPVDLDNSQINFDYLDSIESFNAR